MLTGYGRIAKTEKGRNRMPMIKRYTGIILTICIGFQMVQAGEGDCVFRVLVVKVPRPVNKSRVL